MKNRLSLGRHDMKHEYADAILYLCAAALIAILSIENNVMFI